MSLVSTHHMPETALPHRPNHKCLWTLAKVPRLRGRGMVYSHSWRRTAAAKPVSRLTTYPNHLVSDVRISRSGIPVPGVTTT